MTEEKEAIENLKKLVQLRKDKTNTIKYDTCICSTKELDIVLNLIQKQQTEIENIRYIKKSFDYVVQKQTEKKDKMIDLMAKAWKQDDSRTVEEIIEYFEKQVEREDKQ